MRLPLIIAAFLLPSFAYAGDTYTYAASIPFIAAVQPAQGPVGASVQILGSGFTGATTVKFDGAAATSFAVANDNLISAVAPTGTGTVIVTVTTPNGTSVPPN